VHPTKLMTALLLLAPAVALAQPAPHHTVGQRIEATGEVSLPAGGAPMITVNRSNLFQVTNEPFRALLAGAVGRRVEATLRMVQPGPFGGRVEALSLVVRPDGAATIKCLARPSSLAPVLSRVRSTRIVGATARHFRVKLRDGRTAYVDRRTRLAIGEDPSTSAEVRRLDAFEYTSLIEWGGDHVQTHLKLARRPDGSFRADVDGEDVTTARTDVPVSASAVADLARVVSRFQAFPDDSFAGDGGHWHYAVRATGTLTNGQPLDLSRSFYEVGSDDAAARLAADLDAAVGALVRSLSAGPVTGLIGALDLQPLKDAWETALIDSTAAATTTLSAAARAQKDAWRAESRDVTTHRLTVDGTTTHAVVATQRAGAVDFELLVKVYDAQGTLLLTGHASDSPQVYWD
jgi:hypothetical protein